MDDTTTARLQHRLAELCGDAVPGAVVALTDGETVVEVAHGISNLRTQVPVTTDTVFQLGSITKLFTASAVMALVDQGSVELDAPVRTYLPDFTVASAEVSATVTVRQLLCHTGGFEGDVFTDTGRGDDALRRYVQQLDDAAQVHPLGAMFSYSNSGYSVLGRLIEAVTESTWDEAVRTLIATPLGTETLLTLPEQVILGPHAVGHLLTPGLQVTPIFAPPRSIGPGGILHGTARDVIALGQVHAKDGLSSLSPAAVKAMQQEQVRLADPWPLGQAWGLGWMLPTPGVIGHDGSTFGQYAFYRLHPETGTALALLTNGPGAAAVFHALAAEFFSPLCGVSLPDAPSPAARPPLIADPQRYVGSYERRELRFDVSARDDGGLDLAITALGAVSRLTGVAGSLHLVGFDGDTLITAAPGRGGQHQTVHFVVPEDRERAEWVHLGARATPRTL